MKSFFNIVFYLLFFFALDNIVLALSENQIKERCRNKQRRSLCIENLKSKKINLLQGNRIEIPVIPFKE